MFYEVTSKRVVMDSKGKDKEITEKYIVEGCELFGEAELKMLQYFNNENDVTAIKQSRIREFINAINNEAEQGIYVATIADVFVDDKGVEKEIKYVVALWATSVEEATHITNEYMKQGLSDFVLLGVKRTKFLEVIS